MRTTLNIDDDLYRRARALVRLDQKTAVVREGLKALIERESGRELARLGGSQPKARAGRRRRSPPAR